MLPSLIGIIASSGGTSSATSYESIATVTVGAGGSSSISFSSIASTYQHLQIRGYCRTNYAGFADAAGFRLNSDSGSNYKAHFLRGDGSSASAGVDTASYIYAGDVAGNGSGSNTFGTFVIDILDYANTNKYKTTRELVGIDNNGNGYVALWSGLWLSTSATNAVTLFPLYGTTFSQYSSFALYGIKG